MPLGIGTILSDTFKYFFQKALIAIGFSIIFNIVAIAIMLAIMGAILGVSFLPVLLGDQAAIDPAMFAGVGVILAAIGMGVMITVIYAVLNAFMIQLAYDARIGAPVEIGRYLSVAFRNIIPITINIIIVGLVMLVAFIPIGLLGLVNVWVTTIVAIPLMLWVFACVSMVIPAVLYDNSGFGAVARSFRLTKDYRWPMIGASILFFIIMFIASIIIAIPAAFLGDIVGGIVQLVLNASFGGLMAFFTAMIYARLKEIKDGVTPHDMLEIFR
jgi:hypothetical protein